MRAVLLGLLMASAAAAADDWEVLLQRDADSPWRSVDSNWIFAADARLDPKNERRLEAVDPGTGAVWINGVKGHLPNLVTKKSYGDCELHLEFMLAKFSNSGVKFQGLYEIQFRDLATKDAPLTGDETGGIYPRAEERPMYRLLDHGIPPLVRAAKPPGEWQTLTAVWQAPRFNERGEKTDDAVLVRAVLNGKTIHEKTKIPTPTGANHVRPDTPAGPLLLQCDHGPVAWRNVKIRAIK